MTNVLQRARAARTPPKFRTEKDDVKVIWVRLPTKIREQLEAMAEVNCRSIAQEIQYRVMRDMKSYPQPNGEDK